MSASDSRPLRVISLTSSNVTKHLSWKLRVELMLPGLARRGIQVDTARISRSAQDRARLYASLAQYDVVWLHRHVFGTLEGARIRRAARRIVFDIDDPVGYSSSRWLNFSLAKWLRFRATCRLSDAVLVASDGLYDLARRHNSRVTRVPLCADLESHSLAVRPRRDGEPLRLLWLGGRSTFKYLLGERKALEAIGQAVSRVELHVVGHSRLELERLRVINHAWSPEVEVEQLAWAHVGLSPMANDRWTRAKAALKPLQYLANGAPFLGSPVGVNVRFADGGANARLADRPAAWVDAVRFFEANEPERRKMGQRGIAYVRKYHSADWLADRVANVFRSLVDETEREERRSDEVHSVVPPPKGQAQKSQTQKSQTLARPMEW